MAPIPVTIITGFLGSGKTTLILNLIPQLPPEYKLALLKNEFGDVAIDSQLAASSAISSVQELLNGCICCNLVGQLSDALEALRNDVKPDRIVIETSGSAFPATLAMEVNRIARETSLYVLDGVLSVIDVENWKGYEDTSYTAKLQAKFTDLIVLNKWEDVGERRLDDCLDRIGDLEVEVAQVKTNRGRVDKDIVFGLDGKLAQAGETALITDGHNHDHQSEVEVLSVTLPKLDGSQKYVDLTRLQNLLQEATKDEIYRIKAILFASTRPKDSIEESAAAKGSSSKSGRYILNWAFGRWTFSSAASEREASSTPQTETTEPVARMTIITARCESAKWKKRIENGEFLAYEGTVAENLRVDRIAAS